MAEPRKARLAGLVMALLGPLTYGTTSPFGLLLSAEKLREPGRPRGLKAVTGSAWSWAARAVCSYQCSWPGCGTIP